MVDSINIFILSL